MIDTEEIKDTETEISPVQALAENMDERIQENYDAVEMELESIAAAYKNIIVSKEDKARVKKDLATMRKITKYLAWKKSEVKKEAMRQIEETTKKLDDLIKITTEAGSDIDAKIKQIEQMEEEKKREEIKSIWEGCIAEEEHKEYMQYCFVEKKEWKNKNYSLKKIREDILHYVKEVAENVELIKKTGSIFVDDTLKRYKALGEFKHVMFEQEEKEAAAKKALEEERKREELKRLEEERIRLYSRVEEERKKFYKELEKEEEKEREIQAEALKKDEHADFWSDIEEQQEEENKDLWAELEEREFYYLDVSFCFDKDEERKAAIEHLRKDEYIGKQITELEEYHYMDGIEDGLRRKKITEVEEYQ